MRHYKWMLNCGCSLRRNKLRFGKTRKKASSRKVWLLNDLRPLQLDLRGSGRGNGKTKLPENEDDLLLEMKMNDRKRVRRTTMKE